MKAKAYSRDINGLAALGFPLIVQMDFNHMVVVDGTGPQEDPTGEIPPVWISVNDPACGPVRMPVADFSERFTGIVLVLRPNHSPSRIPLCRASLKPLLRRTLQPMAQRLRRDWGGVWQALPPPTRRALITTTLAALTLTVFAVGLITSIGTGIGTATPALLLLGLLALTARTALLAWAAPRLTAALRRAAIATLCRQPGRYFSMRGADRLLGQMLALGTPATCITAGATAGGGSSLGRCLDLLLVPACLLAAGPLAIPLTSLTLLPVLWAARHRTAPWRHTTPSLPPLPGLDGQTLTSRTGWAFSGQRAALWSAVTGSAAATVTTAHRADRSLTMVSAACLVTMVLTALTGPLTLTPLQTGLILLAQTLLWRLVAVLPDLTVLQRTAPALSDLLTPAAEVPAPPHGAALMTCGLTFGYRPDQPPLLSDLSLHLRPGQQISLTGPSGTGKTTLLHLLAGLDQPWQGSVCRPTRVALLSGNDPFPPGPLRHCLTLNGAIPTDDVRLEQALRRAEAWEFVTLRGGLDMAVPDGATSFSGGQKRRLALARALLTAPTLLLVDEAFDSLDPDLETQIRVHLRQAGIALLAVTQRPASLQMADHALILTATGLQDWLPETTPPPPSAPEAACVFGPAPPLPPLTVDEHRLVRQVTQVLTGQNAPPEEAPDALPGQAPKGPTPDLGPGSPLRRALLHAGVLTRRVRLRPHDRLAQVAAPLLLRCRDRWHFHRRSCAEPIGEALAIHPLHRTVPSARQALWQAAATGALLCGPAALAGGLVSLLATGHPSDTAPALLLLAAAAGACLPVVRWLRSRTDNAGLTAHADLWSWLLFLPLPLLRRVPAETLDDALSDHIDQIRRGDAALTGLPPLLTLLATAVWATSSSLALRPEPLPEILLGLIGLMLILTGWRSAQDHHLSPAQHRLQQDLSGLLQSLPALRLLGADRPALTRWQAAAQRLDHRLWLPDLLLAVTDLIPLAVLLVGGLPPSLALILVVTLATLSRRGGGLAALLRPTLRQTLSQTGPGPDMAVALASPPPNAPDSPLTLTGYNLVYTLPGAATPLIGPDPFTLSLTPGTITALCGPSGCGKTTLTHLLTGVLPPDSGHLLINGYPASHHDIAHLQARTGWLEQDDSLPLGTVRSHVSGPAAVSDADCWQALQAVGMADTIAALPMGLQAVISGQSLPAGQTRLLHLARTLLTRPAVLILDEALSGLETARLPALLAMIRSTGCACLLITHRADLLPLTDTAWEIRANRVVTARKT